MKKLIFSLILTASAIVSKAQCNGEFSLSGDQPFHKFTNGAQVKMTYCGEKSNLHAIMNNSSAYQDNMKLEIENDNSNSQLYHIVLTIKENNSAQYAMKTMMALGINSFYFNGKKINTDQADSVFK